ncbi:putative ribonuclease H-like domain-containing protein [Tanacetum coccineum]
MSLDDFVDVNKSVSESVVKKPSVETSEPKTARKENEAPIIKDWVSDSDEENAPNVKTVKMFNKPSFAKINFVKSTKQVKSPRKTSVDKNRQNTPSPRGNKRNWNQQMSQKLGSYFEMFNKACHVCGSFDYLKNDCNNWYNNGRFAKPFLTNIQRVNKQNFSKLTHPSLKRNMVPRTVLTRSGSISLNTARPVNTVQSRTTVNNARPMKNIINNAYSTTRRPFNKITTANNSNFTKKVNTVNTARPKAFISVVKGNKGNAVKASACWVWRPKHKILDHGIPQQDLKDKGVIDSGCSRHMIGNISYLTDYEEIDEGFVAFGGNSKRGKITRKGKIRSGKLDFKDVYFVKELKFNLLSVSQMCDKNKSVLFTDTKCVVLSPDFKVTDESHVLLKVPRKDNMYSVDLNNVVPQGGLTCLFAKAKSDESNLWYRRLGHVNFKTMNKLVRRNLVRGLPSKPFEINQTCVACQKGKKHKASYKTKIVSSISQPLQMLHMDLFSPTFVKSLMKKMYCLVVTDDFNLRVKVIRCDNGTEFKNRVMNQFCEMKGIKREFSVARTPQQNGVAERKNRTLIEAARTMLADSKLPTTFWAEAVNTACYVQNRVLVIKPHNKTPYELFLGRKPALSFMRPFGCPVTILNTIDHLGKFDGKADEGFFVGYSTNSKAFRVFNSRTRIVEENLHVQFSENTPNIAGSGPNWLFDIDALTKSMNYKPVVAGNQSNGSAGTKACDNAGKARVETVPGKDYILLPLWTQDPPFSSSSKDSPDAGFKPSGEEEKKDAEDPGNKDCNVSSPEEPRVNQENDANVNITNNINTVCPLDNVVGLEDNVVDENIVYGCADDLNMPNLEDIVYSDDDEDVGAEADMNNLNKFMHDELLQFKLQKVWTLVDLPNGKRAIGTTWVYRNKKDEKGIVIKNKAWLVAQGYTQEEWIDYDESAFLYGKIKEKVYVCQPPGFEDPDFPDRVYKVEKAFYGLHQAPKACSTKKSLCTEFEKMMRKKFQMSSMGELTFFLGLQTASTPMETQKLLLKDEDGEECVPVQYQVNPKVSHLHAIKRIFRYLKSQPKLGLWYPKDSPFDLVAYTYSDHVGSSLDRKSTTGVNAGDSKLMLLGINLLLLGKVNAARYKLTDAGES